MTAYDIAGLVSAALIAGGAGLIFLPAGLIVAGLLGLVAVLRLAPPPKADES